MGEQENELKMQETGAIEKLANGGLVLSHAKIDKIYRELRSLAGLLDMLYFITEGDLWASRSDNVSFTILEARDKASALAEKING